MTRSSAHSLPETVLQTGTVIIGAGAAGLSLAASLQGDLIVIESGADGIDWDLQASHRSIVRGQPTNPDSVRVRAIGGATTRWTGRCIELDDYDFEDRPWIGPSGWPIDKDDLAPWYLRAWKLIGIEPEARPPVTTAIEQFAGEHSKLRTCNWDYGTLAKSRDLNFGHRYRGLFETSSRRLIYAADAAELITDGRRVMAVRIVDRGGVSRVIRARRFVLAASCVDNISLLLHKHRATPQFLDHVEPWLGRGFMQHLRVKVGALAQNTAQFRALQLRYGIRKSAGNRRIETGIAIHPQFARSEGIGNASAFFEYETDLGLGHPLRLLAAANRRLGRAASLPQGRARLVIDVEQTVSQDSRVTLHWSVGPSGLHRAEVDWKISPTDFRTTFAFVSAVGQWLNSEGYGALPDCAGIREDFIDPSHIVDSNHPLGGTRMSDDPSNGVVDRNCRVHGCDNLWIVGGSVFPSGGHANPTLTIVAMAIRLADHLSTQMDEVRHQVAR